MPTALRIKESLSAGIRPLMYDSAGTLRDDFSELNAKLRGYNEKILSDGTRAPQIGLLQNAKDAYATLKEALVENAKGVAPGDTAGYNHLANEFETGYDQIEQSLQRGMELEREKFLAEFGVSSGAFQSLVSYEKTLARHRGPTCTLNNAALAARDALTHDWKISRDDRGYARQYLRKHYKAKV